jgi:hypothetical protein
MLGIAFLVPVYHSHDHTGVYHQGDSDDHVLFHDASAHECLSVGDQHNGSHLHIKKDIGLTWSHQHSKGKSLRPDVCAIADSPVHTRYLTGIRSKYARAVVFRSNAYDCLSGLSPPAA